MTGTLPAQGCGHAATSVQWGAWGGSGMALRVAGFMERMARLGLGVVQPAAGLAALAQVLAGALRPSPAQRALFVGAHPTQSCCSCPSLHLVAGPGMPNVLSRGKIHLVDSEGNCQRDDEFALAGQTMGLGGMQAMCSCGTN